MKADLFYTLFFRVVVKEVNALQIEISIILNLKNKKNNFLPSKNNLAPFRFRSNKPHPLLPS